MVLPHADRGSIQSLRRRPESEWLQSGHDHHRRFNKILETLYEKGYVLVKLHDMAYETTNENGNTIMKAGDIMLPPGKIPFVMSQDDLCYYPLYERRRIRDRIVIGEDGKPTCQMTLDDGTVTTGDYDLVPILEKFCRTTS